tara:strand:+ start:1773 stop:2096 length:324 start_codon:yes stop_codon:yes gene_type:complete
MVLTWKITSLDTIKSQNSLSDIVYNIGWKLIGSKSGFTYEKTGQAVHLSTPESSSFVAYNSLTESQVVTWLKAFLGSTEVTAIETEVTTEVDALIDANTESNKALPW